MALGLPGSRFVGVDLAPSAIAEGQRLIATLDLGNIDLRCGDVSQIPSDTGHFDYIIAHGLYSWISAAAQEHVLRICAAHLAPNGVAYVSYNAPPGWHLRGHAAA